MNKQKIKLPNMAHAKSIKFMVLVSGLVPFFVCNASDDVQSKPELIISAQKITVDSVDLSARNFFDAYTSKSPEERKDAALYLLGVMDATEGRSWCNYTTFKSVTLRERIYLNFKKLESNKLNERASKVIEEILSQRYPCGRGK